MTEEKIKEIRKSSSKYIESIDEIERQKKAKANFEDALRDKAEADFLNKKLFLKNNAELTGLTLEFRNIYGIEGGIYNEKLFTSSPFIYPEDTPTEDMYDSTLLVEACGNISSLGEQEMSLNSPFFIDENRGQEGSSFHVPYCPPNLDRWCGDKYYVGYSRLFNKTEWVMINFLNGLRESSAENFNIDGYISGFNYTNPVEFYSNSNGVIEKDIYRITTDTTQLKPPGGGSYTPIIGENLNPAKGYIPASGSLNMGDIISFKLSPASGINSNEIGYAFVYKTVDGYAFLDLLKYDSKLVSTPTTYSRRKLWKFWKPIIYTNPQNFSLYFMKSIVGNINVLEESLLTYEKTYIDDILHYLVRIEEPDNKTKESINLLREVKDAFSGYWANKNSYNLDNLFYKINYRKSKLYPTNSSTYSPRAQEIHEYLSDSDIFDKVYGTINSRINKRTGTLRELIKYAFNNSVADVAMKLKRESITSLGDTIVVYRLTRDTDGTNGIEIQLEDGETVESFYSYIKWMNEVYILSDNESISPFKTRIEDIQKRGDNSLAITLTENIPKNSNFKTNDNARLIKIF
jgi:hypothetical protein